MNTPEPTPNKSHSTRAGKRIEEIDLTGSPEPRRPRKQDYFDLELYVLNHQQSRTDSTTIWHRDVDGSFRAEEYDDLLVYLQSRKACLGKNRDVDQRWAEETWQRWLSRDSHPAVDAFNKRNEPSADRIVLEEVTERLRSGQETLEESWSGVSHAQRNLKLLSQLSVAHGTEYLLSETRKILKDLANNVRSVQESQQQSIKQLESMERTAKPSLETEASTETTWKRKRTDDTEIVDTIKFVKECLNNHSNLVNLVLGRPDPLAQQGTDLMQAVLSEVFGVLDIPKTVEKPETVIKDDLERSSKRQKNVAVGDHEPHSPEPHPRDKRPNKKQSKLVLGPVKKSKTMLSKESKLSNREKAKADKRSKHLRTHSESEWDFEGNGKDQDWLEHLRGLRKQWKENDRRAFDW